MCVIGVFVGACFFLSCLKSVFKTFYLDYQSLKCCLTKYKKN